MALEFEWEVSKASSTAAKHGVTFDEALTAFRDTRASIFDDPDHSADEHRELLIGHSERGRLMMVSFTEREGRIRIISARRATRRERQDYEHNIT
jgi:uncharacterized DUF497 family protein